MICLGVFGVLGFWVFGGGFGFFVFCGFLDEKTISMEKVSAAPHFGPLRGGVSGWLGWLGGWIILAVGWLMCVFGGVCGWLDGAVAA